MKSLGGPLVGGVLVVFGLSCCCLFGPSAGAATIVDDFEDGGPFSVEATGGGYEMIDQSGLAVVGGHRETWVFHRTGSTTETTAELSNTAGDDSLRIFGSGSPTTPGSSLSAIYDAGEFQGDLNLNLLQLGDAFFVQLALDPGPGVGWQVGLTDAAGTDYGIGSFNRQFDGSRYYEIPFSDFTEAFPLLDLTEIDRLLFQVDYFGAPATVEVTAWGVVPEPSSLVLASIAGIVLIGWRLRRK